MLNKCPKVLTIESYMLIKTLLAKAKSCADKG